MSEFAKWRNVLRDALVDVQDARVRQQAMDALDKLDDQHMLTEGRVDNYEHLLVGALAALEVLLRQAPPPLGLGLPAKMATGIRLYSRPGNVVPDVEAR